MTIAAVDFDMGPPGVAYMSHVLADYHVDTGGERTEWNKGRTYRNDAVDIARDPDGTPYATAFMSGDWMQYTIDVAAAGSRVATVVIECDSPAIMSLSVNDGPRVSTAISPGEGWQEVTFPALSLANGTNRLRVEVESGSVWFKTLTVR